MAPQLLNQMLHPSRSEAKAMRRLKSWGNGFDDTLTTFRGRIIPRQSDHLRYNRTREYWVLPAGSWEVMMIKAKLKRPKTPRRRSGGSGRPQLFIKRKRKYVPDKKWFERVAEDQRRDMLKPVAERVQRAHLYHVLDNNVRSNTTPYVELGQTFFPWARLPPDIQDAIVGFAWGKPDELRLEWLGGDEKRFQARRLHHGESHGHDAGVRFSRRHPHHRQRHSIIISAPPPIPLSTLLSVNRAFSTRVLRTLYSLTTLHFTSAADLFRFLETLHANYLPLLGSLVLSTTDLDAFEALTPRHAVVASRGLRSMMLNSGGDEGVEYEDCCGGGEKNGHGRGHHRAPHRGKSLQRVDEDEEGPRRRSRCGGGGCGHAHHKRKSRSISSSDSSSSSSVDEDCCSDGCCGHDDSRDHHHDNHATDTSSSFFFAESESSLHKRRGRSQQKKRQTAHNHNSTAAMDKRHAHHGSGHQHGGGCCGDDYDINHAVANHSGFSIDDDDDDATTEETQWWRRRRCQLPEWLRRWWSSKKNKTLPLHRFWTKGKKVLPPRLRGGKRKKKGGDEHDHHSHPKDKRQQTEHEEEEDERRRSLRVGSAAQPKDVLEGLKSFVLRIEGGEGCGSGEGKRYFRWMRVEDDERAGSSRDTHPRSTNYGGRVVCLVRGDYASQTGLRAVWGADWLVRALRETMAPRMCEVRIEGLLPDGEVVVDEGARGLVVAGGSQQQGSRKGKERAVEAAVLPQEEEPSSRRNAFAEQENSSGDEEWQSAVSSLSLAKPVERSTVVRNTRKQTGTYLGKQGGGAQGIPWRDLMLPNDYKKKFRLELL
ncbi:hypothetical protein BFW01_g1597 [Lasiodiplodia theobromae]|nr:hypothetical protein BFW01_g1597 [Lasiodiplodia theobromae]